MLSYCWTFDSELISSVLEFNSTFLLTHFFFLLFLVCEMLIIMPSFRNDNGAGGVTWHIAVSSLYNGILFQCDRGDNWCLSLLVLHWLVLVMTRTQGDEAAMVSFWTSTDGRWRTCDDRSAFCSESFHVSLTRAPFSFSAVQEAEGSKLIIYG